MNPKLLPLYGPFELNSYNVALFIGIGTALYAAARSPERKRIIGKSDFLNICIEAGIAGIIGARILHIISQWRDYHSLIEMLSIWNGGLSILGAAIAALLYSIWALKRKGLPVLAFLDIAAIYAPIIHAIGRIGCFLTGCCYGAPTAVPWGIIYTHPLVLAPLLSRIHPTQLYSSLFYGILFVCMRFYIEPRISSAHQKGTLPEGSALFIYGIGMSLERFFIDFLRGDRTLVGEPFSFLSFQQWVALGLFTASLLGLLFIRKISVKAYESI